MDPKQHQPGLADLCATRRQFLNRFGMGFGALSLTGLVGMGLLPEDARRGGRGSYSPLSPKTPHFAPKAKRVIYLFQSGAPSQMDLFDPKPGLTARRGEELPASIRMGQRITGMTSGQKTLPVAPSIFQFAQYGKSGAWLSELLPHTRKIVDEMMYNEVGNEVLLIKHTH
ncbi:MAG: DUF1501 domain-containing protein [Nitrospiraceae bacterium]|nr:DUF1501 domain-containing protein [Nitrospiraceae bacterium]